MERQTISMLNPRSFRARRERESRYTRNRHHLPREVGARTAAGVKIREGFGSRRLRGFRIP